MKLNFFVSYATGGVLVMREGYQLQNVFNSIITFKLHSG